MSAPPAHGLAAPYRLLRQRSAVSSQLACAVLVAVACTPLHSLAAAREPLSRGAAAELRCTPGLQPSLTPQPPPAPALAASTPAGAASEPSLYFEADTIRGRLDREAIMEGQVKLQRAPFVLNADRIEYSATDTTVRGRGNVRMEQRGDLYTGTYVQVDLDLEQGYILDPTYRFSRWDAGGQARRIDLLGNSRMSADGVSYTSCPAPPPGAPASDLPWVLTARHLRLDFDANEGVAEAAVVRFYGVPILAAPVLSFPVRDEAKSGWLPPSVGLSNTYGLEVSVPYYWRMASNLDTTLTPGVSSKRGALLNTEFRYLEPRWRGEASVFTLPQDRVAQRNRWSARWEQEGHLPADTHYDWRWLRVSDDAFWKDSLRDSDYFTPRLLPGEVQLQRFDNLRLGDRGLGRAWWYARVQRWQALQDTDPAARFEPPYRREPQLGLQYDGEGGGFDWNLNTELNRFEHEDRGHVEGLRAHVLASLAHPFGDSGWRLTPKLTLNTAAYDLDQPLVNGATRASRSVPTFSLDSAWTFEREAVWRHRGVTQTLEPRLLYVRTPFHDQSFLPNFDSAGIDFNATTVFADNAFSGIDRVSDANQITAGLTTRIIDAETGAETARFGVAQRYLLADQLLTPDGPPLTRQFSDVLLLGSTTATPNWTLEGTLQYSPEVDRFVRTIGSVRYSPGPFRTINATYRLLRGSNEQLETGWQWPLTGTKGLWHTPAAQEGCAGAVYSVGRIDYNMRDKRITDAILGLEYDSGCWIGRIVAQRRSTGLDEATNKLSMQLELVGFSPLSLGANPLRLLKDNIPGYRLLREDPKPANARDTPEPAAP